MSRLYDRHCTGYTSKIRYFLLSKKVDAQRREGESRGKRVPPDQFVTSCITWSTLSFRRLEKAVSAEVLARDRTNDLARDRETSPACVPYVPYDRFVCCLLVYAVLLVVARDAAFIVDDRSMDGKPSSIETTCVSLRDSPCARRWPRNCDSPCIAAPGKGPPGGNRAIPRPQVCAAVAARTFPEEERASARRNTPRKPPTYRASSSRD